MELDFCEETADGRASLSGEGPSSGPGAGLEYDLWEGQFQFVGHQSPPSSSRGDRQQPHRRRGHRLSEQVRRESATSPALPLIPPVGTFNSVFRTFRSLNSRWTAREQIALRFIAYYGLYCRASHSRERNAEAILVRPHRRRLYVYLSRNREIVTFRAANWRARY